MGCRSPADTEIPDARAPYKTCSLIHSAGLPRPTTSNGGTDRAQLFPENPSEWTWTRAVHTCVVPEPAAAPKWATVICLLFTSLHRLTANSCHLGLFSLLCDGNAHTPVLSCLLDSHVRARPLSNAQSDGSGLQTPVAESQVLHLPHLTP